MLRSSVLCFPMALHGTLHRPVRPSSYLRYQSTVSELRRKLDLRKVRHKHVKKKSELVELVSLNKTGVMRFDRSNDVGGLFGLLDDDIESERIAKPATTFADIGGNAAAKEALLDVLDARRDVDRYTRLGARPPTGTLLHGPPGTCKTMLARAFANEAGLNFICASGSEFIEIYGGSGPKGVRMLLDQARRNRPCAVFIDEIDSCGGRRSAGASAIEDDIYRTMSQERDNTLNQLLAEMDGFVRDPEVLVLAATNRLETLDPALLRSGRFDRKVLVALPDDNARAEIFASHAQQLLLSCDLIELSSTIAHATSGMNGADLELIANEAALLAARNRADAVEETHFEAVVDRLVSDGAFQAAKRLREALNDPHAMCSGNMV